MDGDFVLFGDATRGTRRTIELLSKKGIEFRLSLNHCSTTTPTLATPVGPVRGADAIRRFVEAFVRPGTKS